VQLTPPASLTEKPTRRIGDASEIQMLQQRAMAMERGEDISWPFNFQHHLHVGQGGEKEDTRYRISTFVSGGTNELLINQDD
jgi:hypothetical protein